MSVSVSESPVRPVPNALFCVSEVGAQDRFALWKESISCIFDVELDRDFPKEAFRGRVEASLFGELMLARTNSSRQSWARTASTIARDCMDHYMIQLFVEGGMEARHRRGTTSVDGQSLVVFDLAQEMTSRTPDFTNLSLIIPREAVAGSLRQPDEQHMRCLPGQSPVVSLLIDHISGLEQMRHSISAEQAREIASATTALVAACLNGSGADTAATMQEAAIPQALLVRRVIEQHLGDTDLSVADIARMAGISRTRLYALFEPAGGVKHYVRERRLRRALGMLLDARKRYRPIYGIAAACGFANESAFSRAFRQRFGCSPREAREDAALPAAFRDGAASGRCYEDWLHHLAA